jgi:hypothetical protein
MKKCWRGARIIDPFIKSALPDELKKLGWSVCRCQGEADICIGHKAALNPGMVVAASADSDLLFHHLKILLRKDPKTHTFKELKLDDILSTLDISQSQWIVAAIVSNNDYSAHVPGQSFSKNLTTLRSYADVDDPLQLLACYCEFFNIHPDRYKQSVDIFLSKSETLIEELSSNDEIDNKMKELVDQITTFLQM